MKLLVPALPLTMIGAPALAHHPLAGMEMTTFTHGLLSGIGHPVLGFDHLFFVLLMGVAAAFTTYATKLPLAYLGAMVVGVVLATLGLTLPFAEPMIALSLLALGGVVILGRTENFALMATIFAVAGLFHGTAFGGAMASAEAGSTAIVLAGYLIGLAAIQYAIAVAAGYGIAKLADSAKALEPRIAGAMVAGVGVFLVLETVEGAAFAALGL